MESSRQCQWSQAAQVVALGLCTFALCALLVSIPLGAPLRSEVSGTLLGMLIAGVALGRIAGFCYQSVLPVLLFAFAAVASSLMSDFREQSMARSSTGIFLLAAFPAAQLVIGTSWSLRAFRGAASLVVLLVGIDFAAQAWFGASLLQGRSAPIDRARYSGSFANPNEAACLAIIAPLSMMGLRWGQTSTSRAWTVTHMLAMSLTSLFVSLLSGSRAMFIGVAAAIGAMTWLTRRSTVLWAVTIVIAVAGVAWSFDVGSVRQRVDDTLAYGDDWRPRVWSVAWHSFANASIPNQLLGQGPSVFFELHERTRTLSPSLGLEPAPGGMPWVHCVPLEILCERGIVGFVLAAWVVLCVTRSLVKALATPTTRSAAVAISGAAIAIATMSFVDLSLVKDWCLYLFALVGGLACGLSNASTNGTSEDEVTSFSETAIGSAEMQRSEPRGR